MKNFLIALGLLCSISACSPKNYPIGTTEVEFLKHNRAAILVQSNRNRTVYKKVDYGFGHPASVRFYYFENGELTQVDEGVRQPDVLIQNQ